MNRSEAYALLTEYTKKDGLIKHALAVEGVMREYAEKTGEDGETWGVVGLLHDFDYERYPIASDRTPVACHPFKGAEILRGKGVPEEWVTAILGHSDASGVKRESRMAKTLFAVDELTGLIVAAALVRPDKKLTGVTVESVKKKMKDKTFAAAVSRDDIVKGAEELGVPLDEHIDTVLIAMKKIANELGL